MKVIKSPEGLEGGKLLLAVDERTAKKDIEEAARRASRPSYFVRDDKVLPMVAFQLWMLTDKNIESGPCWVAEVISQLMAAGHPMVTINLGDDE
jgi:hypothetical protein